MQWTLYFGLIVFLSIVFSVFLSIGFNSVHRAGNHYRYYKTIPGKRSLDLLKRKKPIPLKIIIPLAFCLAWLIVHFHIFKN